MRYGAGVTYYVEDRLGLSLSADESRTHAGSVRHSRGTALRFGVDYAFLRGFEAPGLAGALPSP